MTMTAHRMHYIQRERARAYREAERRLAEYDRQRGRWNPDTHTYVKPQADRK